MKKLYLSALITSMLIFGQPFTALADTAELKIINFKDIKGIINEQNIDVKINQNNRLNSEVTKAYLKRSIKDLEDDLEDIDSQRDQTEESSTRVSLGTEKRSLLDNLKELERNLADLPTSIAIADLEASMSDDTQTLTAESKFIAYNQLKLSSSDISLSIDTLQKQLEVLKSKEQLGLIPFTTVNDNINKLIDLQNQLESVHFQMDSYKGDLKNLFSFEKYPEIGTVPILNEAFTPEDQDSDLKKALESSYTIAIKKYEIVILQSDLEQAQKDHGLSSYQYKEANYNLMNANLELTQLEQELETTYHSIINDIAKKQSDLCLAEQDLTEEKVALSEAQVRMSLGMITQSEMDTAKNNYQVQENAVKTKQIDLFESKNNYDWFLKGMPYSS
ncbi:hypothetical protein [Desulfosporosinus hippei]|uniref:Outer membrane efflux protein n=1 Tax=Desulfosporosinus hippei DSM 8344 TaxID=1121419 RepID=A0A1G7UH39_9FIRM|nr:hypothetical protein [Desulfosporosinus hippei]SDG46658.1 hypothetical protein SAMN05443529_103138 [Desulfosporosinus hippei DSM 8344]